MIDPAEIERYRLPDTENDRIFQRRIVPALLAEREPQDQPAVVFLIGQPGAGKSRVTELVAERLNERGGFADIDSDLYKPFHPAYDDLMAQDDTLMAAYTRADGRTWMARAEAYVRETGLNAIIQETSQNAQLVEDKMRNYRTSGAQVEALMMGVPQALSNQGIVARYVDQVAERGHGRLTVQANADESYAGISELAARVDHGAGELVERASIYRRGEHTPRYLNTTTPQGTWQDDPALREALAAQRTRPLTTAESTAFVDTQIRVREACQGWGGEWPSRLAAIEQQAKPLLTDRQAQRLEAAVRAQVASGRSTTTHHAPRPSQGAAERRRPDPPGHHHGRSR